MGAVGAVGEVGEVGQTAVGGEMVGEEEGGGWQVCKWEKEVGRCGSGGRRCASGRRR